MKWFREVLVELRNLNVKLDVVSDRIEAVRKQAVEIKNLIVLDAPQPPGGEDVSDDTNDYGPYSWANKIYATLMFPWPTIENPWGTQLAVWKVIDDKATVLLNVARPGEKPNFEENSGVAKFLGETFIGYRKILSGLEANGTHFVVTPDPYGGGVYESKLELVGLINEFGFLVKEG